MGSDGRNGTATVQLRVQAGAVRLVRKCMVSVAPASWDLEVGESLLKRSLRFDFSGMFAQTFLSAALARTAMLYFLGYHQIS